MTAPSWFASQVPVRHNIRFPGAADVAKAKLQAGETQETVDEFLAEHTFWVEVRELSAGDRAELEEMRFTAEGEGKLDFGAARLLTVQMCLTAWSLPEMLTREAVRGLKPLVLDAILAVIDEGRLMVEPTPAKGEANGSGPPTDLAHLARPAVAKDAVPDG